MCRESANARTATLEDEIEHQSNGRNPVPMPVRQQRVIESSSDDDGPPTGDGGLAATLETLTLRGCAVSHLSNERIVRISEVHRISSLHKI